MIATFAALAPIRPRMATATRTCTATIAPAKRDPLHLLALLARGAAEPDDQRQRPMPAIPTTGNRTRSPCERVDAPGVDAEGFVKCG